MIEDANTMTCHEFQARLPDLIGSVEKLAAHPHLQNCVRCRALLADLESIAEAARQLFPVVEPPDHLWSQIESAIQSESDPKNQEGGQG
jgi:predicted anti-sigma-YlaC factor YlaD